jgi:hypothetical protein
MSEFDDFVSENENDENKHQPKKSKNQSGSREEPQQTSAPSRSNRETMDAGTQSVQNQTNEIADSYPMSWDREQFAMFFKEEEVFGYEDLLHDAKGHLKRENVRNDKRYELDQAFIELALEQVSPEEVATRLIENRGFEL